MAAKPPQPPASGKHFPLTSQSSAPPTYQSLQVPAQSQVQGTAQNTASTMSPNKVVNAATFCKIGQEMIHDMMTKSSEIFTALGKQGSLQLPHNLNFSQQNQQERKVKLEEQLKHQTLCFKKLRAIYDKVDETCREMDEPTYEQLVPLVGSNVESYPINSDVYPYVAEEHREIVEQVRVKNQQLKEIIDQIRSINWEINTMITMRKN